MKSTLECLTCKKESTTFDVFTNIPLSLPEPSQLFLNIVVHRLPKKVKYIISPKQRHKKEGETEDPIQILE
jgi:ubiquitin C-terminal hydrolase|tara:strand:+ start:1898 stop:2110 length:213 start_codon:yes stop_codon:yes gene_type:complete